MKRAVLGTLLLAFALSACGGDDDTWLKGPASYDLVFHRAVIQHQLNGGDSVAMIVKYEKDNKTGVPEVPTKVVANFPLQPGSPVNLLSDGALSRTMRNNVQFPDMERGQITFDCVGIGEDCCGTFNITFTKGQGTLNGGFCGKVEKLAF